MVSSSGTCRRDSVRISPASSWPPAGSRATSSTVSSPAMVPITWASPDRSIAEARKCAAPGGVRSTARLALPSAETISSPSSRISRDSGAPTAGSCGGGGAPPSSGTT